MKIAFSTLGCPEWSLPEVIDKARQYGYEGVELRGLQEEIFLPRAAEFGGKRLAESRRRFEEAGLEVVCLGSTAFLSRHGPAERKEALDEVRDYVALAESLGAPFVRVFAGRLRVEGREVGNEAALVENLQAAGEIAAHGGVRIVLETHDDYIAGVPLAGVMRQVSHPAVGILWDIHHPVRFEGEPIAQTWEQIGPWVWHTHVKDSRPGEGGHVHTMLGEGDIPVREALERLHGGGYTGYVSLEWEKRWHPEIDDPEVVFPQYARELKKMIDEVEAA
jgi:sugar phosphate isomerase/epimerase